MTNIVREITLILKNKFCTNKIQNLKIISQLFPFMIAVMEYYRFFNYFLPLFWLLLLCTVFYKSCRLTPESTWEIIKKMTERKKGLRKSWEQGGNFAVDPITLIFTATYLSL